METILESANILMKLHVLCGIVKKFRNFYRPDFFNRRDENGVFSQFLIISGKCVFHKLDLKMMKINYDKIFLNHIS